MIDVEALVGFGIIAGLLAGILGRLWCGGAAMVEYLRLRYTRRGRFESYMRQRFQ